MSNLDRTNFINIFTRKCFLFAVFRIRIRFSADPDLTFLIQYWSRSGSLWIRIQILVRLCRHKVGFWHEKYSLCTLGNVMEHTFVGTKAIWKAGNQVNFLISVNFLVPRSGSAFPIRIRESKINEDPDPKHCVKARIVWHDVFYAFVLSLVRYQLEHSVQENLFPAVLRIRNILVRIRGSVRLTNGSGSCHFRQWPSRWQW